MNQYFTSTSFDSDNSDPAMYNINQLYMPGWDYSNQYDLYPQPYDHNFQNNCNFSQSQWGFTSPESNFQPPCPQFSQSSFPDFGSYTLFPVPPTEEKSDLERSMEAMLESHNKLKIFLIEFGPAHKYRISEHLRLKSASTQFYRNSKWLCGS